MPRQFPTLVLALGLVAIAPAAAQAPIAGAENWLLFERLPGVEGRACMARTNGPEADTMLLLNNDREPILVAGRADWSGLAGTAEIGLSIDGAPAATLEASLAHNLVLVPAAAPDLLQRLRRARTLDWTLPFGRFRAGVTGLGAALDAIAACNAAPQAEPPGA